MRKISPAINACNAFRSSLDKSSKHKKVKFDLATIQFQVDYDIPDDRILKQKIPIWTEHWKRSKRSMILTLLRSVSVSQWFQLLVILICFFGLVVHLYKAIVHYKQNETIISAKYEFPIKYTFPAITICLPIILPYNLESNDPKCDQISNHLQSNTSVKCQHMTIKDIFNGSLSEWGQRCKYRDQTSSQVSQCSAVSEPLETIYRNQKCFTYFSKLSKNKRIDREVNSLTSSQSAKESEINLLIQTHSTHARSLAYLAIHQADFIPLTNKFEFMSISPNRKYELKYSLTRIHMKEEQNRCRNYSEKENQNSLYAKKSHNSRDLSFSDCLSKCILSEMRTECGGHCVSRWASIRRDLVESGQKVCHFTECSEELVEKLEQKCAQDFCEKDCVQDSFDLSVSELVTEDLTETNITIRRKLTPDLLIFHLPKITCISFVASIGGLIGFWLVLLWLCMNFLKVCKYFWELIEIYYM